ncbi:ABC transporter ATP-binding protein [Polycladidibacter hongkongensis]|uniref:ABC transporter ATP-binding protein n=1 Tax=Polycladidibacter hongkongensis TaxID=1647556 RepID=UPI0008361245|nr:ABC transporter ATP-binding protein [Pseudovibrio hongkongensis]
MGLQLATEQEKQRAPHLEFRNIGHNYGGLPAVRDVSLQLERGEVLCLLGHSGCGKTTLLRIAAGVIRQQAGEVLIDGAVVASHESFLPPEARGIGLMFQDYALFPHLSILDNVLFGLSTLPRAEAKTRARSALEMVGMSQYLEDYPHALSGGEQQRVALARAMAPRPHTLLMDEPFSGLDSRLREDVRAHTLEMIREQDATAVVVTHDPEEALKLGDRIALMRRGEIVQLATPEEIYFRPQSLFAAEFFSEVNKVDGVVENGVVATVFGAVPASHLHEGSQATVCVRPHHVRLEPAKGNGQRGVHGRVVRRSFGGESDVLSLSIEGCEQEFRVKNHQPGQFLIGELVEIHIADEKFMVFAA